MGKRGHLGRRLSGGREEGSELVEFALVLLPLALLLFGIIQWGFIIAANMTVRNATVVAARYAIVSIATNAPGVNPIPQIRAKAKQAVAPLLDPNIANPTVLPNFIIGTTTGTSVRIDYNLRLIIPWVVLGSNVSNSHIPLHATTIMR